MITSLSWIRSQVKSLPSGVSIYVKEFFRFLQNIIFKHLMGNFQYVLKLFSQEIFCVEICMYVRWNWLKGAIYELIVYWQVDIISTLPLTDTHVCFYHLCIKWHMTMTGGGRGRTMLLDMCIIYYRRSVILWTRKEVNFEREPHCCWRVGLGWADTDNREAMLCVVYEFKNTIADIAHRNMRNTTWYRQ